MRSKDADRGAIICAIFAPLSSSSRSADYADAREKQCVRCITLAFCDAREEKAASARRAAARYARLLITPPAFACRRPQRFINMFRCCLLIFTSQTSDAMRFSFSVPRAVRVRPSGGDDVCSEGEAEYRLIRFHLLIPPPSPPSQRLCLRMARITRTACRRCSDLRAILSPRRLALRTPPPRTPPRQPLYARVAATRRFERQAERLLRRC